MAKSSSFSPVLSLECPLKPVGKGFDGVTVPSRA